METDTFNVEAFMKSLCNDQQAQLGNMVRRGLRCRAKKGLPTGTVPLGYKLWGGKVKLVEPAASHIRSVFKWFDPKYIPLRAMWRQATQAGLVSKRGKPLSASAFQLLIRNPFYAGYIKFEGKLYKGTHEPLVSPERFEKIQDMLSKM